MKARTNFEQLAWQIASLHNQRGGATVHPELGDMAGRPYYAVAAYPERGQILPKTHLTPGDVQQYIHANLDVLTGNGRVCVGTWASGGQTYLDLSIAVDNLADALRLGRENHQLAVFDLGALEEIKVA